MAVARQLVMMLIPFSYRIEDAVDKEVGAVDGWSLFWDRYTVDMDCERIDPRLAVVGAVVIDAIEEN